MIVNNQYRVQWSYYTSQDQPVTICHIINHMTNYTLDRGTGSAKVSINDKFNKEKGRRISLKRALLRAFPGEEHYKIRGMFWETYRLMTKVPRWKLKS